MSATSNSTVQNLLPVQAYFDLQGNFQTFIGQNKPFYATINPSQSNLAITNSTIDSTTIGATTPSTGVFTDVSTTTGNVTATPTLTTSIANKLYVDTVAQGLNPKQAVQAATTANITLSGTQTIDGVAVVAGNYVLVKNQTTSSQNGVYVVAANRVGQEGRRSHLGRSMVVDPTGAIVAEASNDKEELLVAEIDLDRVKGDQKKIPWQRDRRIDLYGPLADDGSGS